MVMRLSLRSAAAFETINYTYAGGGEAAGTVPELLLPCLITLIRAREEPLRCGGCAKDENGKKTPPIPLRSLEETAVSYCTRYSGLVETTGIEPVTPCMSSKYSNQLSYASVWNGTIITRSAQFVNSLVKICDLIVIFSRGGADFAEHVSIVLQKLRRSGLCYRISFRFAKRKAVHHKRKGKNGQRQSRGVCKQVCN